MTIALAVLAAVVVAQSIERAITARQARIERRELIDAVVARHAGDLRAIRRQPDAPPDPSPEVTAYAASRARDLQAMGYDPDDVPAVPSGFDGR